MNNLISACEYNAEQVQCSLYNIVKHLTNNNDVHCGSQNVSHRECSNCPPSASTQPRSLLCHSLITLSITCWPSCSHKKSALNNAMHPSHCSATCLAESLLVYAPDGRILKWCACA